MLRLLNFGILPICFSVFQRIHKITKAKRLFTGCFIQDSKGAKEVFEKLYSLRNDEHRLTKIFADGGYQGELGKWVKTNLNMNMKIVKRNETDKWEVLPKRWIVERTFAWLMNYRRLAMDYERLAESVEAHSTSQ